MAQTQAVSAVEASSPVSIPYLELSTEQWQAVPRTIPGWILMWGSWLPLIAVAVYLFRVRDAQPLYENAAVWPMLIGAVTLIIAGLAAGRLAPWCAALISTVFFYATGAAGSEYFVLLVTAIGYFLLLGVAGSLSAARFCIQLRRWRREATQQLAVADTELARTGARREVSSVLPRLIGAALAFGLFKAGINFFGDAQRQWQNLDRENLETIIYGAVGLVLWGILVVIRMAVRRFVGQLVLRVPVRPAGGSPIRFGALSGVILREEVRREDCGCAVASAKTPDEEDEYLNGFVKVNDQCRTHGIEAVNAMDPASVARHATSPWMFGEQVDDGLIPEGSSIPLLGLSGWGSRPVRLLEPFTPSAGSGHHDALHHIYPYRVTEVFRRSRRGLRWRGVNNTALETKGWDPQTGNGTVIDRIALHRHRIGGYLVRVSGRRPFFEAERR